MMRAARHSFFWSCFACSCLAASPLYAADMTTSDAFNEGNTFGKAELGTAKGKINTPTASTGVPNYTASDPASSYYAGGMGSLTAPAAAGVSACTSTLGTSDPDPYTHGKCESTRMLMNDPGKKDVMFPLNKKTDPLVLKGNAVKGDADTYLGSLIVSGAYSGCAEKIIKDADKYETETCNQYLTAGEEKCQEILSVAITTTDSCVPGSWYGGFLVGSPPNWGHFQRVHAQCDIGRADGMIRLRFTPEGLHGACAVGYLDVPKTPFTVSDYVGWGSETVCDDWDCSTSTVPVNFELTNVHHWKGSCTVTNYIGFEPGYTQGCTGGTCSYVFRQTDSRWGNIYVPMVAAPFNEPKLIITETDTWDNQCSALEARLK